MSVKSDAIVNAISGLQARKGEHAFEPFSDGQRIIAFVNHDLRTYSGACTAGELFSASTLKNIGVPKGHKVFIGTSWVNRAGRRACYLSLESEAANKARKEASAAAYAAKQQTAKAKVTTRKAPKAAKTLA